MFSFSSALTKATLIKRYKRFLADVQLDSGKIITVHCPNTGAMTGCQDEKSTVYLSHSSNKNRKYAYTWEYATDTQGHKICVNTNNANKVVREALLAHHIDQLSHYSHVLSEQKVNNSRIDFLLQEDGVQDCYLEVKSVTLAEGHTGMFPDAVTARGQKHCLELAGLCQKGYRAVLLFCVMRESISEFKIAEHIDPDYAKSIELAVSKGVEILCYGCELNETEITLAHKISVNM